MMTDAISMIKAHPTRYKNVQFRSRLEARWAAFFDLLDWRWQYEPIDLDGWTPDFSIVGHDGPIYVEVKPIEWRGDQDQVIADVKSRGDLGKIHRSKTTKEVLILGTAPAFMSCKKDEYFTTLGAIRTAPEKLPGGGVLKPYVDAALLWCGDDGHYDYAANYGSYAYRIDGKWDGDGHLHPVEKCMVYEMWREAGNLTQWKPAQ